MTDFGTIDDFYGIDRELLAEEQQARDAIRRFVDQEVRPNVGRWWQEGAFPTHLIPKLGQVGRVWSHASGILRGIGNHGYRLWADDEGIGAGRFRTSLVCFGPEWTRHACHISLWQ